MRDHRRPIRPDRLRRIPASFSWIDREILHCGILAQLSQEAPERGRQRSDFPSRRGIHLARVVAFPDAVGDGDELLKGPSDAARHEMAREDRETDAEEPGE